MEERGLQGLLLTDGLRVLSFDLAILLALVHLVLQAAVEGSVQLLYFILVAKDVFLGMGVHLVKFELGLGDDLQCELFIGHAFKLLQWDLHRLRQRYRLVSRLSRCSNFSWRVIRRLVLLDSWVRLLGLFLLEA